MFVRALPNSTARALLEKNETLLLKDDVLMEIDGEAVGSLPCYVSPLPDMHTSRLTRHGMVLMDSALMTRDRVLGVRHLHRMSCHAWRSQAHALRGSILLLMMA